MKLPKLFIGPMSKNVVDSVLSLDEYYKDKIGFIPSRRQVECTGGYVNNWTTKDFSKYVNKNIIIERDHGGPDQGNIKDDGNISFSNDAIYFDIIHIDPWKKYNDLKDGIKATEKYIKYVNKINNNCFFEIGTEQSIRKFTVDELDKFVKTLKNRLSDELFNKIVFLVIQSGTSLKGNKNIGIYDESRLKEMIQLCKYYNLKSKEHNGDYLGPLLKEKFKIGLDSINIAPEFGYIETNVILDIVKNSNDNEFLSMFFNVCFNSGKWQKWVDRNFNPFNNKEELIKISGHYVFSNNNFISMKNKYNDIDIVIKNTITDKIKNIIKDIYEEDKC